MRIGIGVEGPSDLKFWNKVLHKHFPGVRFDIHNMKNCGALIRETPRLLNLFRSLHYDAAFILTDRDKIAYDNTRCSHPVVAQFAPEIQVEARRSKSERYLFICVAIPGLEAWFLADANAIRSVLPMVSYEVPAKTDGIDAGKQIEVLWHNQHGRIAFNKMEELTAEQALRVAARDGDGATVTRLLDAGTPIDTADMIGYTPLMLAARKGQATMVCLLLTRGADWKANNRPGDTALDFAVRTESVECVRLLLDLEGDITGRRGRSLLNGAHHAEIEQVLRHAGASNEIAHLEKNEVDAIVTSLENDGIVLCKVCQKPLTYHWSGNRSPSQGFACPDGCTHREKIVHPIPSC
jgi:hypothetical protein